MEAGLLTVLLAVFPGVGFVWSFFVEGLLMFLYGFLFLQLLVAYEVFLLPVQNSFTRARKFSLSGF